MRRTWSVICPPAAAAASDPVTAFGSEMLDDVPDRIVSITSGYTGPQAVMNVDDADWPPLVGDEQAGDRQGVHDAQRLTRQCGRPDGLRVGGHDRFRRKGEQIR